LDNLSPQSFSIFKIKTFFEKKTDKREKKNLGGIGGEVVNKLKDLDYEGNKMIEYTEVDS